MSIAAEIVALRWGGTGRPLTATDGPIHTDAARAEEPRTARPVTVAGLVLAAGAGRRFGAAQGAGRARRRAAGRPRGAGAAARAAAPAGTSCRAPPT